MKNTLVMEASTNTHLLVSNSEIISKNRGNGIIALEIQDGIVTHGEHDTIRLNSKIIVKYVQKELNPITRAMQNAFD